jgi:hypothetical protein
MDGTSGKENAMGSADECGTDGWSVLRLAGWEVEVSLNDLGVRVVGWRGDERVVRYAGSVAAAAIVFLEAARSLSGG